jgi:drug/metabolite transporter (DMT)-like permease
VLGETLRLKQITGGLVTISGAILLIIDRGEGRLRLDLVSFCLMSAACLMNACTVVIFKYVALEASF